MDIEELERLEALHQRGAISDTEFAAAKQRLLGDEEPAAEATSPPPVSARPRPWGMDEKTFATLLHLSPFSNYIAPGAGIVLPIVMWVMSKDESPWLDAHGKVVLNWMVSSLIYMIIGIVLFFFIIGIPLLFALWICDIIFSIIGAVRSNEGKVWNYPMAIPFFGLGREDLRPLSDNAEY